MPTAAAAVVVNISCTVLFENSHAQSASDATATAGPNGDLNAAGGTPSLLRRTGNEAHDTAYRDHVHQDADGNELDEGARQREGKRESRGDDDRDIRSMEPLVNRTKQPRKLLTFRHRKDQSWRSQQFSVEVPHDRQHGTH